MSVVDLTLVKARSFVLSPTQDDKADGSSKPFNESSVDTVSANLVVNIIGIDTSGFDQYRQGIELTEEKYFQMGSGAKIHSGEIGNRLPQTQFGMDNGSNKTRKIPFDDK